MTDPNDADAPVRTEARFAEVLRDLWRAVTRATRSMAHLPTLPPTHAAAVRALLASEGLTPTQLAAELRLSRPTISELIRRLEDDGLVVRMPSTTDGRSVVLIPTKRAAYVYEAFRHGVVDVVADAFGRLSDEETGQLLSNIPALTRLLEYVEEVADTAEAEADDRTA
ncbi:MarR family winged helix-turn-helix transcriptional regulator [Streptomyces sp. NPDC048254]|uniref:MarR family winged helix-turn-helix transcriptional regulator n=1 Tax=Streptomyces sp. NPDC048254 TaxID=3365525 RepID=UPI00372368C1